MEKIIDVDYETAFLFKGLKKDIETFESLIHKLNNIKSYKMERRGVIGQEEIRETVFYVMFGQEPVREPEQFEAKKKAMLDKWVNTKPPMTKDDLSKFAKDVNDIFHAHVPLDDKTETKEEHAATIEKRNKIHAENDAKRAKEKQERDAEKVELKKQYPYLLTGDGKMSARILATKNIRRELEREFPGHKFSVTSATFAGGNSIDVRWTDGVKSKPVDEIINKYQYGHFDGMQDMYVGNGRAFTDLFGHAKYVHSNRDISHESYKAAAEELGYSLTIENYKWTVEPTTEETKKDFIQDKALVKIRDAAYNEVYYTKPEKSSVVEPNAGELNSANDYFELLTNEERQGIEIKFNGKPEREVLDFLKQNKFRWNRRTKVWYIKQTSLLGRFDSLQAFSNELTIVMGGDPTEEEIKEAYNTSAPAPDDIISPFEANLQQESIAEQQRIM